MAQYSYFLTFCRRPSGRVATFLVLGAGLFALGCQQQKQAPAAPPPPLVTVTKPSTASVQAYYEYNGYLDAVESVEIRARVKGYLLAVNFHEGDEVKVGDSLYTIDPREYVAVVAKCKADIAKSTADMANGRAQIQLAQADLDRMNRLAASVSQSEHDKAVATVAANKAQYDVAVANKEAAEAALQTAELDESYTKILAPISGRISRTRVTRGNLVGQGETTLLTTIVSLDPLYVYYDAPEKDLVEYHLSLKDQPKDGAVAALPVAVGVATEEGFPHLGRIDFRENRVDTGTGTVRIRGLVPNPLVGTGNSRVLYPGLFTRVQVPNGSAATRLVLPEDALMTGQEGRYVFVVGKDNVIQKRTVTVGVQVWRAPPPGTPDGPKWTLTNPNPPAPKPDAKIPPPSTSIPVRSVVAILKGLEAGDVVVVNGLQKARPGAPVTPEEWDFSPPAPAPQAKK
ncbi:efflux RND transporter periplasmic adaptor subunit [Fimbriiglobus ruber]|uniref:RND efflux system, membrane fusion protein CmeA n=1 Tax=Fimbriiglobus ruber TaxID=1908690 RepID=A0A225E0S1_9BACT|nr:efflux RND transporter periplasmic adaptor subunit [Fimbriiglobus ruber]OWK43596.1 RND efflux system, membrane fusion protein CmeA [Fimbriiglobus ruber]